MESTSVTAAASANPVSAAPAVWAQHKWLIATAVMLGTTLEILDTSIVNVALPHIQGSLSASVDEVTWILTSYLVANGIMIPLTGWLSLRFGRKRYFITSVVTFVIASALCGAAQSLNQMVLFRLVQGAAGAAMIPTSQAILIETFPPNEQGLAMATWGLGVMVAPVIGPTLGGWITDLWSWRWNFYINVPIGMLATVMVYAFVHDPPYMRGKRRIRSDYAGIVLLAVSLGLLQIVLDRGQRAGWFSAPWVCYSAIVSCAAAIALVWHELRFPEPVVDLRLLKIRNFDLPVIMIVGMSSVLWSVNFLNPLFLQQLMGYSAWQAGLAVAPRGVGVAAGAIFVGQVSRRGFDTRGLVALGFFLFAYATWLMADWNLDVSMGSMMWPILLMGVGGGFIFPDVAAAPLACVGPERVGYASSLFNLLRNTGSALGISLVSNLLVSYQQLHQSYLVEHFSIFEAWRLGTAPPRMPGGLRSDLPNSVGAGNHRELALVYMLVQRQAALLAYTDIYRILAVIAAIFIPAGLWLTRPSGGRGLRH